MIKAAVQIRTQKSVQAQCPFFFPEADNSECPQMNIKAEKVIQGYLPGSLLRIPVKCNMMSC